MAAGRRELRGSSEVKIIIINIESDVRPCWGSRGGEESLLTGPGEHVGQPVRAPILGLWRAEAEASERPGWPAWATVSSGLALRPRLPLSSRPPAFFPPPRPAVRGPCRDTKAAAVKPTARPRIA